MSYNVSTGVTNAWINPNSGDFGGSAPAVTLTDTDGTPSSSIGKFILRQDSTGETPSMNVDELRIGTTWADVTPVTLSIADNVIQGFKVFPNPAVEMTNLQFNLNEASNVTVEMYNAMGQIVFTDLMGEVNGFQSVEISTSDLEAGIYMINVNVNGNVITKRVSVAK